MGYCAGLLSQSQSIFIANASAKPWSLGRYYMGLESYLLYVKIKRSLSIERVKEILFSAGMHSGTVDVDNGGVDTYRTHSFELKSEKGLLEAQALMVPEMQVVDSFSLRFSILSPRSVIGLMFDFLGQVNSAVDIEVFDTEIVNAGYGRPKVQGFFKKALSTVFRSKRGGTAQQCLVPLDRAAFEANALRIAKRNFVLGNVDGRIISGGEATTDFIARNGLEQVYSNVIGTL